MAKGKVAGNSPQIVKLEAGKTYAWCSCGLSANQPYCDGSHASTDFRPHVFKAEEDKNVAFCTCKQSNNGPFCDGAHVNV